MVDKGDIGGNEVNTGPWLLGSGDGIIAGAVNTRGLGELLDCCPKEQAETNSNVAIEKLCCKWFMNVYAFPSCVW